MPLIDTHAHAFLCSLPMAPARRYTPAQDCPVEAYLGVLSHAGIEHGVLVQPSFLGTDNSYLLKALEAIPGRLRGIAVVEPRISDSALEQMNRAGVVGIRFNMIGRDLAEMRDPDVLALVQRVQRLGWQVEVHCRGRDIPSALDAMSRFEGRLVFDHFGLPDPGLGVQDPGFRALLAEGPGGRTYVKLSAGYRNGGLDVAACAAALLAELGPCRLVWGSDWPFTQFEGAVSYRGVVDAFRQWVPDGDVRGAMAATARDLFRFAG